MELPETLEILVALAHPLAKPDLQVPLVVLKAKLARREPLVPPTARQVPQELLESLGLEL